jgi:hypothetical protein
VDFDNDPGFCGDCNTECHADELCVGGACVKWVPAVGCAFCPCDVCPAGDACCGYPEQPTFAVCVAADVCPI